MKKLAISLLLTVLASGPAIAANAEPSLCDHAFSYIYAPIDISAGPQFSIGGIWGSQYDGSKSDKITFLNGGSQFVMQYNDKKLPITSIDGTCDGDQVTVKWQSDSVSGTLTGKGLSVSQGHAFINLNGSVNIQGQTFPITGAYLKVLG